MSDVAWIYHGRSVDVLWIHYGFPVVMDLLWIFSRITIDCLLMWVGVPGRAGSLFEGRLRQSLRGQKTSDRFI